jgi:hypothetical protein
MIEAVLKSGKRVENAYLWKWRPKEGWFSVIEGADEDPITIQFDDIARGTRTDRFTAAGLETKDILELAKRDGWIPAGSG